MSVPPVNGILTKLAKDVEHYTGVQHHGGTARADGEQGHNRADAIAEDIAEGEREE
jgi:hypothetical protein